MIHNQLSVVTNTFNNPWPNRFVINFVSSGHSRGEIQNESKVLKMWMGYTNQQRQYGNDTKEEKNHIKSSEYGRK